MSEEFIALIRQLTPEQRAEYLKRLEGEQVIKGDTLPCLL